MSFYNGVDSDERGMLHDLVVALVERLNVQRRLNEDLARQLAAATQRLSVLDALHYGIT